MQLRVLLQAAKIAPGLADPEISSLCYDSRRAGPGSLFFAMPGAKSDGADFIAQAAQNGAAAAVAEKQHANSPIPVTVVPNARAAMADIAAAFHGHPDRALKCVGITGT
ncbi:MAG: Mur ligase domain-containing protein, partial [Terrimicrobiaceae bacterium]